ncbi:MAG TPA: DUF4350 domain-containing protein [Chloroflexota bacterium]|nr:DUF4350 domain-containing protein [Chloroflexota bacterium]
MSALRQRAGPFLTVLVLFLVFAGIAVLRSRQQETDYPAGSSHSVEPDGARALYLWLEAAGGRVGRLEGNQSLVRARPDALLIIQPSFVAGGGGRMAMDDVTDRGGTVILAGHSPTALEYASELGVRSSLTGSVIETATTPLAAGPQLSVPVRTRVSLQGGTPLLQGPDGRIVATRRAVGRGQVVVLSTPLPLSNEGLRDPETARFVYRELVAPLTRVPGGASVLFDESLHADPTGALSPDASLTTRMQRFVFSTPLGWAAVYAGLLVFGYLLLAGRRLGPALRPVRAEGASRTMYEHVQALANLYRRGGQLLALRAHFSRHYRRRVARALGTAAVFDRPVAPDELMERGLSPGRAQQIAGALAAIDAARSERALGEAVRRADAALEGLRFVPLQGYPQESEKIAA